VAIGKRLVSMQQAVYRLCKSNQLGGGKLGSLVDELLGRDR
jgi:hypothetical protein